MLPTLAVIKKEKTVDYVVGLDELGGTDDFNTVREYHHNRRMLLIAARARRCLRPARSWRGWTLPPSPVAHDASPVLFPRLCVAFPRRRSARG